MHTACKRLDVERLRELTVDAVAHLPNNVIISAGGKVTRIETASAIRSIPVDAGPVHGLTIVPGPTDSVKAAISSGSTTPAGPPGLTESYIAVTGTINGTNGSDGNAIFTLATIPAVLKLYRNGLLVDPAHYTLSGTTLTFLIPYIPVAGDTLLAEGTF